MARFALFFKIIFLWISWLGVLPSQAQDKTLIIKSRPVSAAQSFEKIALVIGVSDYRNHAKLPACEADAMRFAAFLRDKWGFPAGAVRVLTGTNGTPEESRANLGNMLSEVRSFVNSINEDSEVVFFYSGHGTRDGRTDQDYMVPMEGNAEILQTLVSITGLRQQIETKKPRRALLVIDACRNLNSGAKAGGTGSGVGAGVQPSTEPEIAELYSCQPLEVSQVGKTFPESVFTHYLLEGLNGGAALADGNAVTFKTLKNFVRGNVSQYVRDNFPGSTQNPTGLATEGDMLLAKFDVTTPVIPPIVPPITQPVTSPVVIPNGLSNQWPSALGIGSTKVNAKDGAKMVYVTPGEFMRGSDNGGADEKPVKKIYLDGYWIYETEVTVKQYRSFCNETGRAMPAAPAWGWKDDHPIVNVSWEDANAYASWANANLPSEAQWEKAARGPQGYEYPWGNTFSTSRLWSSKVNWGDVKSTAPVGSFPEGASGYGCMDMAGNVWEWCSDWYRSDYYEAAPSRNPLGPDFRVLHVLHGGSWYFNEAFYFRASYRNHITSAISDSFGFRCVQAP